MEAPRCRFKADAAASRQATKRQPGEVPSEAPTAKVPRACDLTVETGPKPQQKPKRLPTSAPVNVCMYKVTDDAGDVWDRYPAAPLWQVQVEHAAQRAVTFQMRDAFNDFLASAHAADSTVPPTLQDLENVAGVRLVVADRTDPEGAGFVQWRPAFYVAGDLRNFLLLLDDWFKYKENLLSRDQPFEVHLHPHISVGVANILEDLEYEHYTLNEPARVLPLGIFEAQPVVGKRIVSLNIQIDTPIQISVVITGNTWSFRSRLDAFGVNGGYIGDDVSRKYFRVLRNVDVSDDAQATRILSLIGEGVFKNLALRVNVDAKPKPDTHVEAFLTKLSECPSLHFTTVPEGASQPVSGCS